ncbi:YMGG-like Gly-zipper [Chitinophaga sp. YR627]|uniref:YMGG-like glycine zipper-containing protein n=1 Tax=Chitinophaga sp. YR627 TaxID=1881041 RepID=UPI0008E3794F|nr:YMGG-like glycine zipper-containing protein [Chitinophaga sp. YR627]SFM91310.1 YMGG-like Gly-zipper [Chitinophaga sp. YR627]
MKKLFLSLATVTVLFACNNKPSQEEAIESARQAAVDSVNNANAVNEAKQQAIDSMKAVEKARAGNAPATVNHSNSNSSDNSAPAASTATTTTEKKKGWSHTAKGAVVGAGTGAVTGAIINKNDRVKGAAIGTVVGAGAGAGIGAIVDHAKKKKEANKQ